MKPTPTLQIKVGLLIVTALIILGATIFLMGKERRFFENKVLFITEADPSASIVFIIPLTGSPLFMPARIDMASFIGIHTLMASAKSIPVDICSAMSSRILAWNIWLLALAFRMDSESNLTTSLIGMPCPR